MKHKYSQNRNFYTYAAVIFSLLFIILPTQANAETQQCSNIQETLCPCEKKQRNNSLITGTCLCPAGVSAVCGSGESGSRWNIDKSSPLESLKLTITTPRRIGRGEKTTTIEIERPPGNIEQYLGDISENPFLLEQLKEQGVSRLLRRSLKKGRSKITIDSLGLKPGTLIYSDPLGVQRMGTLAEPKENADSNKIVWGDKADEVYNDCFFQEPALAIEHPCTNSKKAKLCFGYVKCTASGGPSLSSPAFPVSCPLQNNNCPTAINCVLLNKEHDSSFEAPSPFQLFGQTSSTREQVQLLGDIHDWIENFNNNISTAQKESAARHKKAQLNAMISGIAKLIEDTQAKINDANTDPQTKLIYEKYNKLAAAMLDKVQGWKSNPSSLPSSSPIKSNYFAENFSDNYINMIKGLPQGSGQADFMGNLQRSLSAESFNYKEVFLKLNEHIKNQDSPPYENTDQLDEFLNYMPPIEETPAE